MTNQKIRFRQKCGSSSLKCHFLFFQVPIMAVFLTVFTLAEVETQQEDQHTGNTIWGYLSNQMLQWGSLNSIDPDSFLAKLANFSKQNDVDPTEKSQFSPAQDLRDELNLKAHFPVVMIPGISSSTIQSWGTSDKSKKYYRKTIWGNSDMIRMVISDKPTWMELIKLDPITGLDPKDIKLRATEGFDAAEYIFPGYWVWSRLVKNLSAIGYDPNNMYMASYDWRLSLGLLEQRDQYFSKLKNRFENNKLTFGRRSVVLGHSLGSTVLHYFMKWVESPEGGKGGPHWVEDHIENVVHIGGALLGVPKATTFLLTGENRDVLSTGKLARSFIEKFFCRGERVDLIRNWSGTAGLITKGGNTIWGDANGAPDDVDAVDSTHPSLGQYITFLSKSSTDNSTTITPVTTKKQSKTNKHKKGVKDSSKPRSSNDITNNRASNTNKKDVDDNTDMDMDDNKDSTTSMDTTTTNTESTTTSMDSVTSVDGISTEDDITTLASITGIDSVSNTDSVTTTDSITATGNDITTDSITTSDSSISLGGIIALGSIIGNDFNNMDLNNNKDTIVNKDANNNKDSIVQKDLDNERDSIINNDMNINKDISTNKGINTSKGYIINKELGNNDDNSQNKDNSTSDDGNTNKDSSTTDPGNKSQIYSSGNNNSDNNDIDSVDDLPRLLNHTMDMTLTLLKSRATPQFINLLNNNYSYGISTSKTQLKENDGIPRKWSNPLETRLPIAPSTKIFCLYGVGSTTERSYYFEHHDYTKPLGENDKICKAHGYVPNTAGGDSPIPLYIDTSVNDPEHNVKVGIRLTDGDQTVPVLSNGYMCSPSGGWIKHANLYNPGKSPVVAREYQDKPIKGPSKNRGAPTSTRHVEILGNEEMLIDVMLIVSNHGDLVDERLHSNIETIAKRISLTHYK